MTKTFEDKHECKKNCVHISNEGVSQSLLLNLAEFFKVFGDSTRILIIEALLSGEMCVCEIADRLSASQSAISHQLRILRTNSLVKTRREGKTVYYSLDDDHIGEIFNIGLNHISERRR